MGRLLVVVGAMLVIAGLVLPYASRIGLSRLPGDFVFRRGNFSIYLPLMTSILLSILLTLIFWLFRR